MQKERRGRSCSGAGLLRGGRVHFRSRSDWHKKRICFHAHRVTLPLQPSTPLPASTHSTSFAFMFPERCPQVCVIVRPGVRFTENIEGQLDWKAPVQRSAPTTVGGHDDSFRTVSDSRTTSSTSSMQFPRRSPSHSTTLQENWKRE